MERDVRWGAMRLSVRKSDALVDGISVISMLSVDIYIAVSSGAITVAQA